jgi:hypothetical protein
LSSRRTSVLLPRQRQYSARQVPSSAREVLPPPSGLAFSSSTPYSTPLSSAIVCHSRVGADDDAAAWEGCVRSVPKLCHVTSPTRTRSKVRMSPYTQGKMLAARTRIQPTRALSWRERKLRVHRRSLGGTQVRLGGASQFGRAHCVPAQQLGKRKLTSCERVTCMSGAVRETSASTSVSRSNRSVVCANERLLSPPSEFTGVVGATRRACLEGRGRPQRDSACD